MPSGQQITELHPRAPQLGRILLSTYCPAGSAWWPTMQLPCAHNFQAHQATAPAQAPYYELLPLLLCAGGVSFGVMDLQHSAVGPKCHLRPMPCLQSQQRAQGMQLRSGNRRCAITGVLSSSAPNVSASSSEWGQCTRGTVAQLTMSAPRCGPGGQARASRCSRICITAGPRG